MIQETNVNVTNHWMLFWWHYHFGITYIQVSFIKTSQRLERVGRKILRGCEGLWVEALNFLEFFAPFCFKTKRRNKLQNDKS
jgi:hypothetical protein